ncbi:MAG: type II/IV secretion system protein [Anaerohalosphaera sp.]|nr:type II/IV secretion system protein [Anaerohalosphaera sp.]
MPDMRVRYRVDGILVEALEIPASAQSEIISHIKILADMDISEKRLPQDGHICFTHQNKEYDLRIASLPATSGEKIVIRILDNTSAFTSLRKIAPDKNDFNKFKALVENPYGIILLTGPTGSGKTTTLYSLLQEINSPDRNIVTVEDPVEYRLDGVTQVQVKSDIGLTFASCLRNILRQDPDVILIGEIRDSETAEIAISAAQTGHLVLSTLHTNDAAGAISRLVNLGIPPFQVASALLGAVAQRLVRAICPKCKTTYPMSEKEKTFFGSDTNEQGLDILHKGQGCEFCRNTGHTGRVGIYEILTVSQGIREMIVEERSSDEIRACAVEQGMKTLKMQGISKALSGATTLKELYRVVDMREN